jgi:hypothetical protein
LVLHNAGGGKISFESGTFDLGTDYFVLHNKSHIIFEGQGIDVTFIQNSSNAASDTEPFNSVSSDNMTIRDMTIRAGGTSRSTSDAIDFDDGSDNVVERVKITTSRSRGIVFDGKDAGGAADRNIVRNSVITGITGDGIELLAANDAIIENNTISNVGGHGIQINKASSTAAQADKQSLRNIIRINSISNSGQDGININSGTQNQIISNIILNSSQIVPDKDGIRIMPGDLVGCDANNIESNTASDNQIIKTQRYGLNISSSLCQNNIVTSNTFTGNKTGSFNNLGTGTVIN